MDPGPDLRRATVRTQVGVIRRAFDGQVLVATTTGDEADAEYLYRPGHVLSRREARGDLEEFFRGRQETYDGWGEVVDEPVDGLDLYRLPSRRSGDRDDVLATLDDVDDAMGRGVATPDHVLYVTPVGRLCPATEPAVPPAGGPVPALHKDPGVGKGVRVSVVDTGWYADAASDPDTPWLASGVQGDLEHVSSSAIHEYAGHGTFVAGIVRCLAPATEIEVEGVLTKGGAVFESEIARQLHEAMVDRDKPDLISISAGTHSRHHAPLLGFAALSAMHAMTEGDDAVLVVAAAGNDSSSDPFWPAAFDWVVSVGAVQDDGTLCDFSNHGPWVDVYAHGRDLVNAFPTGTYTTHEDHTPPGEVRHFTTGLAQWSGTSFATPIVTGAIAAFMSQHGVSARAARDALVAAAPAKQDPTAGSIRTLGPPFV